MCYPVSTVCLNTVISFRSDNLKLIPMAAFNIEFVI